MAECGLKVNTIYHCLEAIAIIVKNVIMSVEEWAT